MKMGAWKCACRDAFTKVQTSYIHVCKILCTFVRIVHEHMFLHEWGQQGEGFKIVHNSVDFLFSLMSRLAAFASWGSCILRVKHKVPGSIPQKKSSQGNWVKHDSKEKHIHATPALATWAKLKSMGGFPNPQSSPFFFRCFWWTLLHPQRLASTTLRNSLAFNINPLSTHLGPSFAGFLCFFTGFL